MEEAPAPLRGLVLWLEGPVAVANWAQWWADGGVQSVKGQLVLQRGWQGEE